jgi:hypothetical protein
LNPPNLEAGNYGGGIQIKGRSTERRVLRYTCTWRPLAMHLNKRRAALGPGVFAFRLRHHPGAVAPPLLIFGTTPALSRHPSSSEEGSTAWAPLLI